MSRIIGLGDYSSVLDNISKTTELLTNIATGAFSAYGTLKAAKEGATIPNTASIQLITGTNGAQAYLDSSTGIVYPIDAQREDNTKKYLLYGAIGLGAAVILALILKK